MPSRKPCSRSSSEALAESTMMGMWQMSLFCFMRCTMVRPSMMGIMTSVMMKSGIWASAMPSPRWPFSASITV